MNHKLKPQNIEAEEAVLGSLLIDPQALFQVAPFLVGDDFYIQKNQWVYESVLALNEQSIPVDFVTLCDELERREQLVGVGGAAYITRLINAVPSAIHAESYGHIVEHTAIRRAMIGAANVIVRAAYNFDIDVPEVQAVAEGAIIDARREKHRRSAVGDIASGLYDQFEQWINEPLHPGQTRWTATGLKSLDAILGGLEPGVYCIAARPSVGKTAVMLQMVEYIAGTLGERCVVFTIEMSAKQVLARLATGLANVELQALKQGRTGQDENNAVLWAVGQIADWPLAIIDQSTLRPSDVLAAIRHDQIKHGGVSVAFVDGLWLMTPEKRQENRTQSVGSMSRDLKRVQRELDIPLVFTHQLNRGVESRQDKRPVLSDLRDSGDIEQDIDVGIFQYRAGIYDANAEDANVMELWILKNRLGGPSGEVAKMFWRGSRMRCLPMEQRYAEAVEFE